MNSSNWKKNMEPSHYESPIVTLYMWKGVNLGTQLARKGRDRSITHDDEILRNWSLPCSGQIILYLPTKLASGSNPSNWIQTWGLRKSLLYLLIIGVSTNRPSIYALYCQSIKRPNSDDEGARFGPTSRTMPMLDIQPKWVFNLISPQFSSSVASAVV